MYSGLIRSTVNQTMSCHFGESQTASLVFNEGKSSVHAHSAHWNKMATCDIGPVTVISCFSYTFGLFYGMPI